MTQEVVRALSDSVLGQVIAWAQDEKNVRTERHKQETIAKIRELAESVGVPVSFAGVRGRPKGGRKLKPSAK